MTARETVLAAFALASSGRPDEAKALLRDSPAALKTEEGLDLLARIELSIGNEDEARRLWTLAGDSRSRRALDALKSFGWKHRKAISWSRTTIVVAAFAFVAFFALRGIYVSF